MARDKIKSASLHSFHEDHGEPLPVSLEPLVHDILQRLGEDPTREGLRQTPARVEASLRWLTRGYHMAVADVIGDALYSERHENLVCVRDIEVYSLCEHHLLPFFGRAHVAYLPNGRLVGLSKIPRVIEVFARRLQVQERLTDQVADVIGDALYAERHENLVCVRDIEVYSLCEHHLLPFFGRAHVAYLPNGRLVGLSKIPRVIEAYHLCMMMRGVEKQNSKTVTSALRGALLQDAKTRDEFLRLVHGGRGLE